MVDIQLRAEQARWVDIIGYNDSDNVDGYDQNGLWMKGRYLEAISRRLMLAQLTHTRRELEPCCGTLLNENRDWGDRIEEPHGMHSDDGWDYLQAALKLSQELHALLMLAPSAFLDWTKDKVAELLENGWGDDWNWDEEGAEPSCCILDGYYACDGICDELRDFFTVANKAEYEAALAFGRARTEELTRKAEDALLEASIRAAREQDGQY